MQPNGAWTFTGNGGIDALPAGANVTQSFTATVTDDKGATATQTVVVTVVGTNDAPVTKDGEFETDKGDAISGQLFASDVDAGDVLTFSLGTKAPANGTVTIAADGGFTYTPKAGFQGLDTFDFTVSDGNGGTSTSRATVAVVSESGASGGSSVSLDIQPEGTILSTASPVDAAVEPRHRARPVGQHRRDRMAGSDKPGGRRAPGAGRALRRCRDLGRRPHRGLCLHGHEHADLQPHGPRAHRCSPRPALSAGGRRTTPPP